MASTINLARVNISLDEFQRLSKGDYNAGEVRLAGETTLAKMNNHVSSWFSNSESISHAEVIAIKEALVRSLSGAHVAQDEIDKVRRCARSRRSSSMRCSPPATGIRARTSPRRRLSASPPGRPLPRPRARASSNSPVSSRTSSSGPGNRSARRTSPNTSTFVSRRLSTTTSCCRASDSSRPRRRR